ncbi:MAG: flagellar biosynthetic protein FliO [Defluviitaleaceae bacterium]|nr:flagellar biosynthetic protein FliO [Defluviitaleaceae bacterium]
MTEPDSAGILGSPAGVPSGLNTAGNIFALVAATIFVMFLAYFVLRFIGGARNIRKSGNISVIEATGVGYQNNIALVRAGEQYFLLGVSRGRVTMLGEIDPATITEGAAISQGIPFEGYLSKIFKKNADAGNDGDGNYHEKKSDE